MNYLEFGVVVVMTWLGLAVVMGKYMAWRWSMDRVHIVDPQKAFDRVSWN